MIDLKKERNFFETRVIEYQTGGALTVGLKHCGCSAGRRQVMMKRSRSREPTNQ